MSACYRLVLESVCRSNHHRIAVLALQHLKGEGAESWRNLFLRRRADYLEGARAPNAVFRISGTTSSSCRDVSLALSGHRRLRPPAGTQAR